MSTNYERYIRIVMEELAARVEVAEATPRLTASALTYSNAVQSGALIANLSLAFGPGTSFQVVGSSPSQLVLSNGTIRAGTGLVGGDAVRTVKIRAISADGKRELAETFSFIESGTVVAPTYAPSLDFSDARNSQYIGSVFL